MWLVLGGGIVGGGGLAQVVPHKALAGEAANTATDAGGRKGPEGDRRAGGGVAATPEDPGEPVEHVVAFHGERFSREVISPVQYG